MGGLEEMNGGKWLCETLKPDCDFTFLKWINTEIIQNILYSSNNPFSYTQNNSKRKENLIELTYKRKSVSHMVIFLVNSAKISTSRKHGTWSDDVFRGILLQRTGSTAMVMSRWRINTKACNTKTMHHHHHNVKRQENIEHITRFHSMSQKV